MRDRKAELLADGKGVDEVELAFLFVTQRGHGAGRGPGAQGVEEGSACSRRAEGHAAWLRHTYASLLIEQGENLVCIKDQMGHGSIQVTVDYYGHLVPDGNRAAVDKLDDALGFELPSENKWKQSPAGAPSRPTERRVKSASLLGQRKAGARSRTADLLITKPCKGDEPDHEK